MALPTFLSNATINITQGATTYDVSSAANQVSMEVGYDALEVTSFGDNGRRMAPGLQSVSVSMTLFLSYGATAAPATEIEKVLNEIVGKGTTTLTISPSGTTESATNPEYVISNCNLASYTGINSTVGEISTVQLEFTSGTWVRDAT